MKETSPQGTTVLKVTQLVVSWPKVYLTQLPRHLEWMSPSEAQVWMRNKSTEVSKTDPEFSWNLWWVALQLEDVVGFRFTELPK